MPTLGNFTYTSSGYSINFQGTSNSDSLSLLTVTQAGYRNISVDGGAGVDTVNYGSSSRSLFKITSKSDGTIQVDSISGASSAVYVNLKNVELISFNNGADSILLQAVSSLVLNDWTSSQLRLIATSAIATLTSTQVQSLSSQVLNSLTSSQLRSISTTDVAALTTAQVQTLGSVALNGLTSSQLRSITTTDVAALTTAQVKTLGSVALNSLTSSQLISLTTTNVAALTTAQVQKLGSFALNSLTSSQLQAITTTNIRVITTTQIQALSSLALNGFATAQIQAITSADIAALTTSQVKSLSSHVLNGLTSSQLRSISTADIAALTSTQVQWFSSQSITSLSTMQIRSITTSDIAVMITTQIKALSSSQLSALTSSQIASFGLSTTTLMSLTTAALSGLTTTQIQSIGSLKKLTPIVLDLHDNGINTNSLENGTSFDLANTGQAVKTGWVTGGDALLVRDINRDGIINNGGELFGEGTVLANGQKAKDGYEAMSALDSNHDGVLNKADKAFSQLQVWVDNGDGITQRGELHSLTQLGITSISLNSQTSTLVDNGNLIGLMGSFTTADGKTHTMGDVWFQTDSSGNKVFDLAAVVAANKASINHGTVHLADQTGTLSVGLSEVLSYGQTDSVGNHQLVIDGGHSSAVNVAHGGDWSAAGHVDSGGEQYAVYVDPIHQARLLVNEKINVLL